MVKARFGNLSAVRQGMDLGARDERKELLTPGEVARLFGVEPKTVTRWADAGKLTPIRTLGGHRRYRASEVFRLLDDYGGQPKASS